MPSSVLLWIGKSIESQLLLERRNQITLLSNQNIEKCQRIVSFIYINKIILKKPLATVILVQIK